MVLFVLQPEPEPTPEVGVVPGIIPRPDSGSEPDFQGDRGSALQLGLLLFIVVAIALIAALVIREVRRRRQPLPTE